MWPTAWLNNNHADVLTFSMILMLINIQVRALDLSGSSVFRHVECHDLTSHQHYLPGTIIPATLGIEPFINPPPASAICHLVPQQAYIC